MNTSFSKRLIREIKEYETQQSQFSQQGIYFQYDHNDLTNIQLLIIGPHNTPYQGGFYFFKIFVTNQYPLAPPKIEFVTKYNSVRFHPNLYVDGKVCLSILGTWSGPSWTPCMTITTIALTIQSIMTENPLTHEPSYYNAKSDNIDCQKYTEIITHANLMGAVIHMLKNIPPGFHNFQNIINNYFITHFKDYNINSQNYDKIITSNYGMTYKLDYKIVKTEFESMLSILEKEKLEKETI
jgi:ubiquitin-conjugating enzyme E2 Z